MNVAGRPASAMPAFHQDRVGYARIELPGKVARHTARQKRRGVAKPRWSRFHGRR